MLPMDLGLTDKIAIVTGSSRGLGLASAAALVQEGCRVTICARGEARLADAAAELRQVAAAGSRNPDAAVLRDCRRPGDRRPASSAWSSAPSRRSAASTSS